jgi:AcrR family transcriptional regulator
MRAIDRSKGQSFAASYEDGKQRLAAVVEAAVDGVDGREDRLSAGLRAGLDFLAANPALAHLLLVESLATTDPARVEHERGLAQLAELLRPPPFGLAVGEECAQETARLLAGGLASHLSGRVLAGEAENLGESHDLLLGYLLTPSPPTAAPERRAARV